MPVTIYTIGHSNHQIEAFLDLLQRHEIAVVADVRSSPYSRWQPQFNQSDLRKSLSRSGIRYEQFCEELGARSPDQRCYEHGRVIYQRLADSKAFRDGIARLRSFATTQRVAMLCAEREPLECHRSILIGKVLDSRGDEVLSILGDGSAERWAELVSRLLRLRKLDRPSLFESEDDLVARAFLEQEEEIAFRPEKVGEATE
ncbi:MAG: DUF488 family protein [Fimbriimonas sp.]